MVNELPNVMAGPPTGEIGGLTAAITSLQCLSSAQFGAIMSEAIKRLTAPELLALNTPPIAGTTLGQTHALTANGIATVTLGTAGTLLHGSA